MLDSCVHRVPGELVPARRTECIVFQRAPKGLPVEVAAPFFGVREGFEKEGEERRLHAVVVDDL